MAMRLFSIAVYLFLYVPIGIIVLFSFNSGSHASDFQGFSIEWYGKALSNVFVIESLDYRNALVDLFLQSRNWPFGSAVAITLVAIMLVTVTLYMRLTLGRATGRDESLM